MPEHADDGAAPTSVGAALRRCVGDTDTFAEKYLGIAPLLRHDADVSDLLTLDDVDELIADRGLRTPFIRLARAGTVISPQRYTGSGGLGAEVTDQVRDDQILAHWNAGATIVLQGLHRIWPALREFCRQLAGELGCAVQANAYATPAGGTGFATHYDTHDVLVLQVAGRKHWRIHEPTVIDPLDHDTWGAHAEEVAATATGIASIDTVLTEGDVLYLPRGWLHAAEAGDTTSLHITLGLRRPTRSTILDALAAVAARHPQLRAGLPLGLDPTDPVQLAPHLDAVRDALIGVLDAPDTLSEIAAQLRVTLWPTTRPGVIRPLAQAADADALTAADRVVRRPGLRCTLTNDGATVRLQLTDRILTVPAGCDPALRQILSGDPVTVCDLRGLDAEQDRLVLARRLLREAVVVRACAA